MKKIDIYAHLANISKATYKKDHEVAHRLRDELYHEFIVDTAKRKDTIGRRARMMLKLLEDIDFEEYCS